MGDAHEKSNYAGRFFDRHTRGDTNTMTYVVRRATGFAGYYRDPQGKRRSTGIQPTKREAQVAADRAEAGLTPEGKPRQDMTLDQHYERWANRRDPDILPNTARGYEHAFRNFILPSMGDRLVTRLTRSDVEDMLSDMRADGVSEHLISIAKAALGSCLRGLVPHVLAYNPTHGIKIKKPPTQDYDLLTEEEIKRILQAMPTLGAKNFAYTLSVTGARHGEAAELRVMDLRVRDQTISITRRVTDLIKKKSDGKRFLVIPGTKAGIGRGRTVGVGPRTVARLEEWIRANELAPGDLLFPDHLINPDHKSVRPLRQVKPGGHFHVGNRTFQHGTAYGYSGGGCRCSPCRDALRTYRLQRKTTQFLEVEHLSTNTWGKIWRAAVAEADLSWRPRSYDLRHYFATSLVANNIPLPEVCRLMGHQSVETTMRYQRRVDSQTSMARDIMDSLASDFD